MVATSGAVGRGPESGDPVIAFSCRAVNRTTPITSPLFWKEGQASLIRAQTEPGQSFSGSIGA